nr:retrovirus-related Pol polyprotein from transposon TNT 1-94 [Tanacetum cinerariifolium]
DEASKKDLEDLFQDLYDEYFDSSMIMKPPTTNVESSNVEVPSHEEEVFHDISESFQGESSLSSLNDDVQKSPKEVILPQTNTQSISNNMVPNGDEASTSHNVFNKRLEDAYFVASTLFHDPSNVYTYYQPYPHENKWTKNRPLHKIIGDKLVCWSSKKQNSVSISTAESKYVAVSSFCAQVLWMRTQLTDYGFFYDKVPIYCDSKSAIAISCNPVQHTWTKHIDVRFKLLKRRLKAAFENVDSSSRVELIPSKIKYAIKVVLSFHNEFSVFSSLSRKENDGLLQDQVFKNKEEVINKVT